MKLTYNTILDKFKFVTTDQKEFSPTDILFDDRNFNIDFFVCSYGGFLNNEKVLVSPLLIDDIDLLKRQIHIDLNSKKVKNGPSEAFKIPVSEEYKGVLLKYPEHTIYPYYFGAGPDLLGLEPIGVRESQEIQLKEDIESNNHTRAMTEVSSYMFTTKDDKTGSLSDWIIDTNLWKIVSVSAEVGSFWNKELFLLSAESIYKISFMDKMVFMDLSMNEIKKQGHFYPDTDINVNQEITKYDYYGRARDSKSI